MKGQVKYHGCLIIKVYADLGEERESDNHLYEIYKDGKYINTAITYSSAKEFIDSGFDSNYL